MPPDLQSPDAVRADAASFMAALRPSGPWHVVTIDPETDRIGHARTWLVDGANRSRACRAVDAWVAEHAGRNCYFAVNRVAGKTTKPRDAHMSHAEYLHVDVDPRDGVDLAAERDRLRALFVDGIGWPADLPRPSAIIDSGSGFQALWALQPVVALDDEQARERVAAANRWIAAQLGGDHTGDVSRILRLPGTTNHPNARKRAKGRVAAPATLVAFDELTAYSLDEFGAVERPAGRASYERRDVGDELPGAVRAALEADARLRGRWEGETDGLADESDSAIDLSIATMLAQRGVDGAEIEAALRLGRIERGAKRKADRYYVETTERGLASREERPEFPDDLPPLEGGALDPRDVFGYKAVAGSPPPERRVEIAYQRVEAVDPAAIPKRRWIAPPAVLRGAVTGLVGRGGMAKSQLALQLGMAMSAGRPWGEFDPGEPRRVLLYNAEDDRDEMLRRIAASFGPMSLECDDLGGRLVIITSRDLRLLERENTYGPLHTTGHYKKLDEVLTALQSDVLILDPFVSLTRNTNENDAGDTSAIMSALRRLAERHNMGVVAVHHATKGRLTDQDSARGSGAFTAACRVVMTMGRNERGTLVLQTVKGNYSAHGWAQGWEIEPVELPNGDTVAALKPTHVPTDAFDEADLDDRVLEAIERAAESGKPFRAATMGESEGRVDVRVAAQLGADASAVAASITRLLAAKRLERFRIRDGQRKLKWHLRPLDGVRQSPSDEGGGIETGAETGAP